MKTIEITSGDQKVLFTTRSVTFDGKEFLYAHMENVIHSTEKHVYTFTYDGEVKLLPYAEKDEKTLNAIFSQVQKMAAQKRAAGTARTAPETPREESAASSEKAPKDDPEKPEENTAESAAEKEDDTSDASKKDDTAKEDNAAKEQEKDAPKDASIKVSDVFGKFKSKKSKEGKSAKADGKPADAAKAKSDASSLPEKAEEDPEKAASREKSLKVFGIIIAILLVCSVAYYFIFGTPSAPAPTNPNTTEESQQYDDIDQLIEDLQ